jgi:hypothetical protein
MKRSLAALVSPAALSFGSLGVGVVVGANLAIAASHSSAMMTKTWHGKVGIAHAMMGTTESFSFESR